MSINGPYCTAPASNNFYYFACELNPVTYYTGLVLDTSDKENNSDSAQSCARLKYTGDDIAEIAERDKGGIANALVLQRQDTRDRLVWLACWFLPGVLSAEVWKAEVTSKLDTASTRKNIFSWVTASDLAYLCVVYVHNYKRWIREAKLRGTTARGPP